MRPVLHATALIAGAIAFTAAADTDTISLSVGASLNDSAQKYPEGTVFLVKAGLHRLQSVSPKARQVFTGENGAVMSGARLLTNWTRDAALWVHGAQTQQGQVHGDCRAEFPNCKYPEDLFRDDSILTHVTGTSAVKPGTWFFDYAADKVYIADDPAGHRLEIGTARAAFSNRRDDTARVTGVVIRNLIVEKYAIPAQMGAIGDQYPGRGWIVDGCEIRFNHGTGVTINGRAVVRNCHIHRNGQKGVGAGGRGGLIEGNEIDHNLTAGFDWGWEGGGSKFANTESLTVRNNHVHHNMGPGLWTDIRNRHTLYEGNLVEDNASMGIFHEISYDAVIRCNTVRRNAVNDDPWLYGAQILISASQNVEVFGNVVTVDAAGGNGICVINQQRGEDWYSRNNYVHHNTVVFLGTAGQTGAAADWDQQNFWTSGNNRFDYNTYYASDLNRRHWAWKDASRTWSEFRAQGQEANGRAETDLSKAPVQAACASGTPAFRDRESGTPARRRHPGGVAVYRLDGRRVQDHACLEPGVVVVAGRHVMVVQVGAGPRRGL
jgi:hypothetical protein